MWCRPSLQFLLCLLLVSLSALSSGLRLPSNCTLIQDIFRLKNITLSQEDNSKNDGGGGGGEGGLCGQESACCSRPAEERLLQSVGQDLHSLLYQSFGSVRGMLASTQSSLAEKVNETRKKSENMTLGLFAEVYKGMWTELQSPVNSLYSSLAAYLDRGRQVPTDLPPAVPTEESATLRGYVQEFFRKLFPPVYQEAVHSLSNNRSAVSEKYAECLSKSMEDIRPFGSYPETLGNKVAKSFEATKVLIQSLSLGIEVLDVVSSLPENTDSCREALLRLYYCPKCLGLPSRVKPCNGYCLNVMRGCLTQQRTTELDLPWSNFLVEVERLVQQVGDSSEKIPSIDTVLYSFSSTISDAIMFATMNGPQLEKQVKARCGPPETVLRTTPEPPPPAELSVPKRPVGGSRGLVGEQLRGFAAAVEATKARGFFANLAEALCSDDSFAETRDTADCWNGHRVGEYTKPLVRPGLDAQKYNPELKWTETAADPSIRHLSDKLRHMRQVVLSHFQTEGPGLISFSQTMGSGSGESWKSGGPWDDTDDSDLREEGSGSGDGKIYDDITSKNEVELSVRGGSGSSGSFDSEKSGTTRTTGSGAAIRPNSLATLLTTSLLTAFLLSTRWPHL